jgi:hypothetical protein
MDTSSVCSSVWRGEGLSFGVRIAHDGDVLLVLSSLGCLNFSFHEGFIVMQSAGYIDGGRLLKFALL